jgi:putative nucleotidyltransferase with HDIG domain
MKSSQVIKKGPAPFKPIDINAEKRKREIIAKLDAIPPLPAAAQEVLSIISGEPANIKRLEQVILHDPALTSQLLKVANSAAYSPASRIDTVQRAIVFLGFSEVRSIALSLCIGNLFKQKKGRNSINRQRFWEHSIATAIISRILALEVGMEETDLIFTCGLLHDLGHLVLDLCFPEEWEEIIRFVWEHDCSLLAAERHFGYPHNLIGMWLARTWGLPEVYARTIAGHHLPVGHSKESFEGHLVQLADHLSHELELGLFAPPKLNKESVASYLGLGPSRLELLEEHLIHIGELADAMTAGFM